MTMTFSKNTRIILASAAVASVTLLGTGAFFLLKDETLRGGMMSDGMAVYLDSELREGEIREEQFYLSSYDWRHFMLNYHAEEYRTFVTATDGGLILPDDEIGQVILNDFIANYATRIRDGLSRITVEDARRLLRMHQSILTFALRENGAATCLAYAYRQYSGIEPPLRVIYIERKEQFRSVFHEIVGTASQDLSPVIPVTNFPPTSALRSLVQSSLTEDQILYMDNKLDLSVVPQGFVCQLEIDILEALISSESPDAQAHRLSILNAIYDPERATRDLRRS